MEVLVVVGGGVGGGHGGDGGGDHFQMANVDYPPNSTTPIFLRFIFRIILLSFGEPQQGAVPCSSCLSCLSFGSLRFVGDNNLIL